MVVWIEWLWWGYRNGSDILEEIVVGSVIGIWKWWWMVTGTVKWLCGLCLDEGMDGDIDRDA